MAKAVPVEKTAPVAKAEPVAEVLPESKAAVPSPDQPGTIEPAAVRGLARLEMSFADLTPAGVEEAPVTPPPSPESEEPELLIGEPEPSAAAPPPSGQNLVGTIIAQIDGQFGSGYAQNHPELIGPLLQATLADSTNQQILRRLEEIDRRLLRLEETLARPR